MTHPRVLILKPENGGKACDIAAAEFQKYYQQITGERLPIIPRAAAAAASNATASLIVIGSDAVNRFCRDCIEQKIIAPFRIRTGTDDFHLLSARDAANGRDLLFLAGGRPRATLYAVYHFFETRAGCSWFWDGDVVPKMPAAASDFTGLDLAETPRFEYRGLRYFAHRGLHRFQAEHWNAADWEREIDWLVKKRLNVFMLRIGMDDVWQKAFPDIVPYPPDDAPLPEAGSDYDDRTSAWPLKYRGELRRHILQYARDRDLMHPEDFGTITHWYSRTPLAFLQKANPRLLAQTAGNYVEQTGLVFDIRDDAMLDHYFRLTQAHIEHYGAPELFHTIGLAERDFSSDRKENLEIKLYTYRRLIAGILKRYPNARILLAGWDLFNNWHPDEVPALLRELNPANTLLWDYEADAGYDRTYGYQAENNFTNWDVVGKFPYTFGIFEALEAAADIRANYTLLEKRFAVAASDPFCKGYLFWPEVSHADILMLEYFTHNAWHGGDHSPQPALERLCRDRYRSDAGKMRLIWRQFLPCTYPWHGENYVPEKLWCFPGPKVFFDPQRDWLATGKRYAEKLAPAPEIFRALAEIPFADDKPFVKRDALDVARTLASRLITLAVVRLNIALAKWKKDAANEALKNAVRGAATAHLTQVERFADVLSLHDDYSMNATLAHQEATHAINPCFPKTLVANAANHYCASWQYEIAKHFYIPVARTWGTAVNALLDGDAELDLATLQTRFDALQHAIRETPLTEMHASEPPTGTRFRQTMLCEAEMAEALLTCQNAGGRPGNAAFPAPAEQLQG
ncbi:MAG: hypothetical protein LBK99_27565 [Opitutaceae bacterium]|jgi:hypothetical protein|nr:hypothetical protein [Opitutaceae bacterium]